MITNPFLRKIVKESGRCEITTSMIVEAEKAEREVELKKFPFPQAEEYYRALGAQLSPILQQLSQFPSQESLSCQAYGGGLVGAQQCGINFGYLGIGAPLFSGRCPYCGK